MYIHPPLTAVPPQDPVIYIGDGRSLASAGMQHTFNEGSELSLLCEVIGGSPPPKVTWHFRGKILDDTYTLEHGGITVNRLDISKVTREFARARLICRASNTHLVAPLNSDIVLDINCEYRTGRILSIVFQTHAPWNHQCLNSIFLWLI